MRLDIATQDPRNTNPLVPGDSPISIYDPATGAVHAELLDEILAYMPVKVVQYRVYTSAHHTRDRLLARACEQVLTRHTEG